MAPKQGDYDVLSIITTRVLIHGSTTPLPTPTATVVATGAPIVVDIGTLCGCRFLRWAAVRRRLFCFMVYGLWVVIILHYGVVVSGA